MTRLGVDDIGEAELDRNGVSGGGCGGVEVSGTIARDWLGQVRIGVFRIG